MDDGVGLSPSAGGKSGYELSGKAPKILRRSELSTPTHSAYGTFQILQEGIRSFQAP